MAAPNRGGSGFGRRPGTAAAVWRSVRELWQRAGSPRVLGAAKERELARQVQDGLAAARRLEGCERDGGAVGEAEHADLRRRVARGSQARATMVDSNLRLIGFAVAPLGGQGFEPDDLVQEGVLALMAAVELFDPDRGPTFAGFAVRSMRYSVLRALGNTGRTVRLPLHVHDQAGLIRRAERELPGELGRTPTTAEVADRAGLDVAQVRHVRAASVELLSLDAPMGEGDAEGDDFSRGDLVAAGGPAVDDRLLDDDRAARVEAALATLSPRSAGVLRLRFGLDGGGGRTLEEVGHVEGIGRERVRQIQAHALYKLRDLLDPDDLR